MAEKDFRIKDKALLGYDGADETVIIPDGVERIAGDAFRDNKKLKKVIFPDSVVSIDDGRPQIIGMRRKIRVEHGAFSDCERLESVVFGSGLKKIGVAAFACCAALKEIVLPAGIVTIARAAFLNCKNLRSVAFLPADRGNGGNLRAIGREAFYDCESLEEIALPEGVKKIEAAAFGLCSSLRKAVIPKSVSVIEDAAFSSCPKLSEPVFEGEEILVGSSFSEGWGKGEMPITEKNGVRYLGSGGNPWFIALGGLPANAPNAVLTLENDVKIIAANAFERAEFSPGSIGQMTLPEGLVSIGANAFSCQTSLREVRFPSSLRLIGKEAFSGCVCDFEGFSDRIDAACDAFQNCASEKIPFRFLDDAGKTRRAYALLSGGAFPDEVSKKAVVEFARSKTGKKALIERIIGNKNAAALAAWIRSVSKPFSYEEINDLLSASEGDAGLSAVLLDCKNKHYTDEYVERFENEKIEKELGLRDYSLEEVKECFTVKKTDGGYRLSNYKGKEPVVEIPARISGVPVTAIERIALNDYNVTEVFVPEGVKIIGDRAFKNSGLTAVHLPSTLEVIGSEAFCFCAELAQIDLPEGLTSIGPSAFCGCHHIKTITLPGSLKEIDEKAFAGCLRLREVINHSSLPLAAGGKEYGCAALYACAVHKGESVNYVEHDGFVFMEFGEKVFLIDCLTDGDLTDQNARIARWGWFGDAVIGYNAQTENERQFVTLPASFNGREYELAASAFFDHRYILEVRIPDFIKKIPDHCFNGCGSLRKIALPTRLESIGSYAFHDALVDEILLPDAFRVIEDYAFYRSGVREIRFARELEKIGQGAFGSCNRLHRIDLSGGVQCVCASAFHSCFNLEAIVLPREMKAIGASAFRDCNMLTEICIPDGIEKIEDECFFECKHIEKISIPASVREIGKNNFPHRALKTVSFRGTRKEWDRIKIGPDNGYLLTARIATTG